jgi:hypothetical protein
MTNKKMAKKVQEYWDLKLIKGELDFLEEIKIKYFRKYCLIVMREAIFNPRKSNSPFINFKSQYS